jgi:hypothetical protein
MAAAGSIRSGGAAAVHHSRLNNVNRRVRPVRYVDERLESLKAEELATVK